MEHLASTHLVMGAVGVATRRRALGGAPASHAPRATSWAPSPSTSRRSEISSRQGVVDRVFAPRIDIAASLAARLSNNFVLQDRAPASELRARGVDDRDTLSSTLSRRRAALPGRRCIDG
ncbi:MAG: hypothetical protein R3A48_04440 [Polyangiales bacterium]